MARNPRYPRVSGSAAAKAQSRAGFVATGGVIVTPPPTPAPSFTNRPSVTGAITAGQAVNVLTFTDGVVANGTVSARDYLLAGGVVAADYVTQAADAGKAITFRNTATGTDGSTIQATSTTSVAVAAAGSTAAFTPSVTTPGMSVFPSAGLIASA
jgi:hypothetical protein